MEGYITAYHKESRGETVTFHTGEIIMQTRKCVGCNKTFKVTSKSPQVFAKGDCSKACGVKITGEEKPIVVEEEELGDVSVKSRQGGKHKKPFPIPKHKNKDALQSKKCDLDKALGIGSETMEIKGVKRQVTPEKKWEELVNRAKPRSKE